jgi:hypothetical protein
VLVHQHGANINPAGDTSMPKNTMIALIAALVLITSFASGANAQRCVSGEEGGLSAYPAYMVCR